VRQHRKHPSIIVWAFCNEYECLQTQDETGFRFREAALAHDTARPLTANGDLDFSGTCIVDGKRKIEIQGHSHRENSTFTDHHEKFPDVPQLLSECCSCTDDDGNQRLPIDSRGLTSCIAEQNSPGLLPFVAGSTGVWTLFDYFGEQQEWPNVVYSYGQMDIAGFPKPHAYWYRSNWFAMIPEDGGRPPITPAHVSRVLSLNVKSDGQVAGVVSTDKAELIVDGASLGQKSVTPGEQFSWTLTSEAPSKFVDNITLLAIGASKEVAATHSVFGPGDAANLGLSIDVPSPLTGTGSSLLLDGHDMALLRLELLDSHGRLATDSDPENVTFSVVSGPGRIAGIGNGDMTSHCHQPGSETETYGALARVLVQVSVDCTSPHRELVAAIDADTQAGIRTKVLGSCPTESIVVVASTASGKRAQVTIPVSGDAAKDSPEAVASQGLSQSAADYIDQFMG